MDVRPIRRTETSTVGEVLWTAFERQAQARAVAPPWASQREAALLAGLYREIEPEGALLVEEDDRIVGAGFVRRRGEIAALGPIVAVEPGRGIGSLVLRALLAQTDEWGCLAVRLLQEAWNTRAFALFAGQGFSVVDMVAQIERPRLAGPRLEGARGLDITPLLRKDLGEVVPFDLRLTGLDRAADLEETGRFVARRRGTVVGFLGARGGLLGPAVALDAADLSVLVARALVDLIDPATARLSTAAPTAVLAMLALGFRVAEMAVILSRGVSPPARPPQLYSILPEVL